MAKQRTGGLMVELESESWKALPRFYLKPRKALPFYGKHPWVFSGALARREGDPKPGDEVALVNERGEFVARGLYNPDSQIVLRLYSFEPDRAIDSAFLFERIEEAIRFREKELRLRGPDSACRLVFSESDGLSGLVVDEYAGWLLVQLTSRALALHKEALIDSLQKLINPRGIWLRTEKGIREAEGLEIQDGLLSGEPPPESLLIQERGLKIQVDLRTGQKTGWFLDQRENRIRAADWINGPRVLDLFCYGGGFALQAARKEQVQEVLCVDISESALKQAAQNAESNGLSHKLRFEKHDVFKWLSESPELGDEKWDAIILDPPKLARNRARIKDALRGYTQINSRAMSLLRGDGILVSCSCTGLVTREMFESMLSESASLAGKKVQILESSGAAPDHPVSIHCLEAAYLKCYICRVW